MKKLSLGKVMYAIALLALLVTIVGCGSNGNDNSNDNNLNSEIDIDWDYFNQRAREFVMIIASGNNYGLAADMFDDTMSEVFGADGLEEAWAGIVELVGEFIEIYEIQNSTAEGFFISGVIMRHEAMGFGWNIVFSEDGLIAGLNTSGTVLLSPLETDSPGLEAPVLREGFTDYPIVIGEDTGFPLNGILSMPHGDDEFYPAVVIVHGSGPIDMDGNIFGNTPYRDIAEFLAANGIAVIRYDKRTLTHGEIMMQELGGNLTVWHESIDGAILAAEFLRTHPGIDENRVFMIGHSLGGMLAPRIQANGGNFNGLILMAASPRNLPEIFIEQTMASIISAYDEGLISAEDMSDMLFETEYLEELFATFDDMGDEEAKETFIPALGTWAYYFREMSAHPFAYYAENTDVPVLVLQGDSDFQVLADVDFVLIQELFEGHDDATFKLYEGLNHLFMPTLATSFVQHANEIVQSPGFVYTQVLQDIVDWIIES